MARWSVALMDPEEGETERMIEEYVRISEDTTQPDQNEPDEDQHEHMWQVKIAVHEGWRLLRMHVRHLSVVAYWRSLV